MFTQRVALFDQSGICNYGDLYATRDTPIEAHYDRFAAKVDFIIQCKVYFP